MIHVNSSNVGKIDFVWILGLMTVSGKTALASIRKAVADLSNEMFLQVVTTFY
ncbi:hypothetical protein L9Z41_02970 [Leptospira noguchii]|uniref:hypothetical protein n=1 Tax=Leptospira noguchii TaxID=28182 RepID=UPI001F062EE6|nr:hypothetical protein [Leptospira noguchii]MCH1911569.1 hypothetical protein [Leptospira noguchii]MCH1914638.1 hypothetical protein [Leptospira noguchii]UOG64558.1 hypothetical protein MAL04_02975 [Leptospira noguchii]